MATSGGYVTLQVPVLVDGQGHGLLELDGLAPLAVDTALYGALGEVAVHLTRVAERARAAAELTARSLTDPLTSLGNRRSVLGGTLGRPATRHGQCLRRPSTWPPAQVQADFPPGGRGPGRDRAAPRQ